MTSPLPASPYSIAREALALAEKATPGPWRVQLWMEDMPRADLYGTSGGRIATFHSVNARKAPAQAVANQELCEHAGTYYAALARELLRVAPIVDEARALENHTEAWDDKLEPLFKAVRAARSAQL